MSAKTDKRASGSASAKKKKTPKFLLVVDADERDSAPDKAETAAEPIAGEVAAAAEAKEPAADVELFAEQGEEDWPEREGIRDGLVDQVTSRFGIPPEVAMRAVNDMLRLA